MLEKACFLDNLTENNETNHQYRLQFLLSIPTTIPEIYRYSVSAVYQTKPTD